MDLKYICKLFKIYYFDFNEIINIKFNKKFNKTVSEYNIIHDTNIIKYNDTYYYNFIADYISWNYSKNIMFKLKFHNNEKYILIDDGPTSKIYLYNKSKIKILSDYDLLYSISNKYNIEVNIIYNMKIYQIYFKSFTKYNCNYIFYYDGAYEFLISYLDNKIKIIKKINYLSFKDNLIYNYKLIIHN